MKNRIERGLYWDRAWQLVNGCTKVSSGCQNCWSERESAMRVHNPNEKISSRYEGLLDCNGKFNGDIRLRYDNLDLPLRIKKPTRFAIWNDLFHKDVQAEFIFKALITMHKAKHHTFFVLTKRPENMKNFVDDFCFSCTDVADKYADRINDKNYKDIPTWFRYGNKAANYLMSKFLPNVYLGVTAENQEQADNRIPILLQIPAAVRFVSVEPMLGPVDLTYLPYGNFRIRNALTGYSMGLDKNTMASLNRPNISTVNKLDWVIIGAESGQKARKIDNTHILELVMQCSDANIPVFLKQAWINNKLVKMPKLGGQIWDQFPF